jgi:hypothetical protein
MCNPFEKFVYESAGTAWGMDSGNQDSFLGREQLRKERLVKSDKKE